MSKDDIAWVTSMAIAATVVVVIALALVIGSVVRSTNTTHAKTEIAKAGCNYDGRNIVCFNEER